MSDRVVRAFLHEMEHFAKTPIPSGVMSIPVKDVAENLRRAVDAPDTPQVIRTVEELRELDPDTLLIRSAQDWADPQIPMLATEWASDWEIEPDGIFPLAVVTPAEQVRDARKALEEA